MTQSVSQLLLRLWCHINPRRRVQLAMLLVLMILTSFAEIISIGAVLPFLAILTDPDRIFMHPVAQPFIHLLGITDSKQLLLPLTVTFGLAALVVGAMRLLLLWASTRLSYAAGADLSISIYRRTLYQPYSVHVARNSSEIITGIANKTDRAIYIINMTLYLMSSIVMLIAILIALIYVDPVIAVSALGGFGLIYALIIQVTRRRLLVNSKTVARESTYVIKSLQEGLGGIRDVLIDGSQATFCQIYKNADQPLRRAQGDSTFISSSPRYGMEALGMLLISILAYTISQEDGRISMAIPILGAIALGAQRMLPILQQAFMAWSTLQGGQISLRDILELLDQQLPSHADQPITQQLPFNENISLDQVSFRYSEQSPWVLKNLDLTLTKGSCTGFIGATGSGKSTLLDIVMGLLQPTNGSIKIDDRPVTANTQRAWQRHIAHVPQTIYLSDSTIEENIAFGLPKERIDQQRVRQAAIQAQIGEVIESWPKKYQTVVGERGIRLSGGQRQRIGIARALYKQADVLIFDEATSALDNETESAVMQAIEGLSKELTLLIIAHRLTTLKYCNQIVELGNCGILRVGTYREIVSQSD
jgi:ABC-type multidrug transport system fused ATPase/permease subunit